MYICIYTYTYTNKTVQLQISMEFIDFPMFSLMFFYDFCSSGVMRPKVGAWPYYSPFPPPPQRGGVPQDGLPQRVEYACQACICIHMHSFA